MDYLDGLSGWVIWMGYQDGLSGWVIRMGYPSCSFKLVFDHILYCVCITAGSTGVGEAKALYDDKLS